MKLLRYGEWGANARPARCGWTLPTSLPFADIAGTVLHPASLDICRSSIRNRCRRFSGSPRIGACVPARQVHLHRPQLFDHAETGATVPPEPIIFMRQASIVGPDDDVLIPRGCSRPTGVRAPAWSSARRQSMSARPKRWIMLPATASP